MREFLSFLKKPSGYVIFKGYLAVVWSNASSMKTVKGIYMLESPEDLLQLPANSKVQIYYVKGWFWDEGDPKRIYEPLKEVWRD